MTVILEHNNEQQDSINENIDTIKDLKEKINVAIEKEVEKEPKKYTNLEDDINKKREIVDKRKKDAHSEKGYIKKVDIKKADNIIKKKEVIHKEEKNSKNVGNENMGEEIIQKKDEAEGMAENVNSNLENVSNADEVHKQAEELIRLLLNKPLPTLQDDIKYFHNKPPPPLPFEVKDLPPAPIRLSLEEDYPNRTITHLDEMTSKEYRQRQQILNTQWYYDEFNGIYRQNAPGLYSNLKRQDSSLTKQAKPESFISTPSTDYTNSTIATTISTTESWPTPRSIEQVHQLKKQARSLRDRKKLLELCHTLMGTACEGETNIISSPVPGTPPVNTRYSESDLRKKKKDNLMLDQVLILEAQKILKKLAMGNGGLGLSTDSSAQFLLANCYGVGGLGLPLDREKAFALYLNASKQNHVESIYRVGCCYEIGIGTRKDNNRALQFYRKAASQSHVASMYKLSVIYLLGHCGQPVNLKECLTWLQRAVSLANAQNPHALFCLAMFQLNIKDFEADSTMVYDPTYAVELLHESANLNYIPSQVKLGELYETGNLVDVDESLSIYWYTRAASQGNADAALALSSWYLTGSDGILPQSDYEAYLWARKAAACQNAEIWTIAKAYFLVGTLVDKRIGISENSTENSKVWFKRAAALGHLGAMEKLKQL